MDISQRARFIVMVLLMSLFRLFLFPATSLAATGWMKYFRKDALLNQYHRAYTVEGKRLWMGTYGDGVVIYDGRETKTLTTKNSNSSPEKRDGLISDHITCLAIDQRNSRVWIGTNAGLSSCDLDGKNWQRFDDTNGLPNVIVRDVAIDNAGRIWVATPSGVAAYDGANWQRYDATKGLHEDNTQCLQVQEDGVWVATVGGSISRFDGDRWTTYLKY